MDAGVNSGNEDEQRGHARGTGSTDLEAPESGLQDWTADAMCIGKTEHFFARPGERDGRRRRREALAISYCNVCPVKATCLLAGRLGREHGIWGGENDEQRAAAGFAPRSPHRRAVAQAARLARIEAEAADMGASA